MQRYTNFLYFFLFSLLLFAHTAAGQSGSWFPANADLSYPRTMFRASQLTTVQNNLAAPELYNLFTGVYADALATPPASVTERDDRRASARIAKNAAFVLMLDRKPVSGVAQNLTAAEQQDLQAKVIALLENLNPTVEPFIDGTTTKYEQWQWRTKELIDYLTAYDLLKGTGTSSSLEIGQQKLQQFAGNLYFESTRSYFIVGTFYANVKNNHALMTTAALGLAAVVLNDATSTSARNQPQNWINAAMYHTDNVMWRDAKRQSEPGKIAGYAEGPYYFKYAFYNCLPFFRAMGHFLPDQTSVYTWNSTSRSIRNPYYDPNYDLLYQWATTIMLPDGRLPALEDSYIDMGMPELMLTGKPQYVKPMDFTRFSAGQQASLDLQLNTTVDLRAAYIAAYVAPAPAADNLLTALPESGNLIFRSGNTAADDYFHVYGKNGNSLLNSGGHNHGDAGSFQLYGKGQLLALDPGYIGYSQRSQVGNANNHNLVLVNGAGPAIGTPGAPNDAQAYVQNSFSSGKMNYGEVRTAYQNANITRKAISVRNEYYILADFITSGTTHNYTWQLHGYGLENGTAHEGVFTDDFANGKGYWQKNGVTLQAHVTATDGVSGFSKPVAVHELTAGATQNHTVMLAEKSNAANTQFLAMLQPYTSAPATVQSLNQSGIAGIEVSQGLVTDLIFTQSDALVVSVNSSLQAVVASDASLTTFSHDAGSGLQSYFLQNGTQLNYGSVTLLQSTERADIAIAQTAFDTFTGYTSKATVLTLAVDGTPANVTGSSNWQYNAVAKTLTIALAGPASFDYKVQSNPLPVELVSFKARRKNNSTAELTWTTATETENAGFEILKRTADEGEFKKAGFVKGKGNSTALNTYTFQDLAAFGPAYYQLRQLDTDGTASLSPVVFVDGPKNPAASLQVWPVPANEVLHIQPAGLPENAVFELTLLNASGTAVHQQTFKSSLILDVSRFTPGLYFLQIVTPETQQKLMQKLLITR